MPNLEQSDSCTNGSPTARAPSRQVSAQTVSFQGVSRRYGARLAVDHVDLEVASGEFLSLVGPSGSGKTTLLMMLAGFEVPDSGRIVVGGKDVSMLPPNRRNLGVVFQKYALFPHRTVAENIGFPLRMRGLSRDEQNARVQRALRQVRLDGFGSRLPAQLSGGEQQRVALARAIVFEPSVILMDEPLGALDRKLRQHMQTEIKQLQQQLGATVIYVTHDQDEALSMSDRLAVFDQGRIVQVGPPEQVYDRPESAFAAGFLGEMNFLPATLRTANASGPSVDLFGSVARLGRMPTHSIKAGSLRIGVRPERVKIRSWDAAAWSGDVTPPLAARITQKTFAGGRSMVLAELAESTQVRAEVPADIAAQLNVGDRVALGFDAAHAYAFEANP